MKETAKLAVLLYLSLHGAFASSFASSGGPSPLSRRQQQRGGPALPGDPAIESASSRYHHHYRHRIGNRRQRRHPLQQALDGSNNGGGGDDDDVGPAERSLSTPRGGSSDAEGGTAPSPPGGRLLPKSLPKMPTLVDFEKFALPCLGLWVASPLLSLVDTAFVGLSGAGEASARQLAALGPATTFFDGSCYLFAFLNVATTNLFSSAKAKHGVDDPRTQSVVRTACRLSVYSGIGIMLFMFAAGRPLMRLYIGEGAASTPGLLDSAVDYVGIRALSMPTTLLLGALQAALLGAQDSVTPLISILYSTVVNVIGDFVLVNRLKWGLQGAAIATTAAQWTATLALIGPARRKLLAGGKGGDKNPSMDIWKRSTPPVEGGVTGRAFLAFAAPVLTLIVGKLAAFGFMTNSAAGVPGQPTPLASHQILLSLLFFCSPFFEVVSQTAQTFLPQYYAPVADHVAKRKQSDPNYDVKKDETAQKWIAAGRLVSTELLGMGLASAVAVAGIASLIPFRLGHFITSDKVVQQAIRPLAKYLLMGALLWAPVAVSEGVLLARRELKFLAAVYLFSTALLPPALLKIKFSPKGNVGQVWSCFCVFQLFRALCFTGKIWGRPIVERLLDGMRARRAAAAASRGGGGVDSPVAAAAAAAAQPPQQVISGEGEGAVQGPGEAAEAAPVPLSPPPPPPPASSEEGDASPGPPPEAAPLPPSPPSS